MQVPPEPPAAPGLVPPDVQFTSEGQGPPEPAPGLRPPVQSTSVGQGPPWPPGAGAVVVSFVGSAVGSASCASAKGAAIVISPSRPRARRLRMVSGGHDARGRLASSQVGGRAPNVQGLSRPTRLVHRGAGPRVAGRPRPRPRDGRRRRTRVPQAPPADGARVPRGGHPRRPAPHALPPRAGLERHPPPRADRRHLRPLLSRAALPPRP